MTTALEAIPAHDVHTEQAVLGSMLLSAGACADCLELLAQAGPEVFYRPAHQMIYEAISDMAGAGEPVDAVTVSLTLERRGQIGRAGGAPYLHTLIAGVAVAESAPYYVNGLLDLHMRRSVGTASIRLGQLAEDSTRDRADLADMAHQILDEATGLTAAPRAVSAASLLASTLELIESGPGTARGMPTGWRDVDDVLKGLRPGQLVTVGGRPGSGKSVVLLNIAAHNGLAWQRPVLVCSLEMSRQECMERILASAASVSYTALRDGSLDADGWDRLARQQPAISAADYLMINDSPDITLHDIRADLRAMRRAGHPAELLVLDYLQLMSSPKGRSTESRQIEVSELSRSLKKLAKEFQIPVLVGSQLNRGPELRIDHRPLLADLRESGSVEQDSDIVILLYRPDAYEDESPRAGEIDLDIAKNRQGPKQRVPLAFRGHYAACADLYRGAS